MCHIAASSSCRSHSAHHGRRSGRRGDAPTDCADGCSRLVTTTGTALGLLVIAGCVREDSDVECRRDAKETVLFTRRLSFVDTCVQDVNSRPSPAFAHLTYLSTSVPTFTLFSFFVCPSNHHTTDTPPRSRGNSTKMSAGAEVTPPPRKGVSFRPPILCVFAVATLVSTGASMGGGLVMYFESLASLEVTVETTSKSEMEGLENTLKTLLVLTTYTADSVRAFHYNNEVVSSHDPRVVSNQTRAFSFSNTKSMHLGGAGYVLVPYDIADGSGVYSLLWNEPLKEKGKFHYVHGEHHKYLNHKEGLEYFPVNHSADPPVPTKMMVHTSFVDEGTGELGEWVYDWNGVTYLTDMLPRDYDPRDGVPPPGWDAGLSQAVGHKWRPPRAWRSVDGSVYTYSGYDSVHVPPPAPHPWSKYRAVLIVGVHMFLPWQADLDDYKARSAETTVALVDAKLRIVFASTTGRSMIDRCMTMENSFSVTSPLSCATRVDEIPSLKKAFDDLVDEDVYEGTFRTMTLDGEEHFVRRSANFHQDLFLLWYRPKSTVQGKVQEALVVLIIFTTLVFAFDLLVSTLEVVFIAQPMRQLSAAIQNVSNFETESATAAISRYDNAHVVIKEINSLMVGMLFTIQRLEEFRTFMPQSVVPGQQDEAEESAGQSVTSSSEGSSAVSRMSSSQSASAGAPAGAPTTTLLGLHLTSKDVGLLYVNALGWDTRQDSEGVLRASNALAAYVLGCVAQHSGVLDNFSGDRYLIGWNTARRTCSPATAACNTALRMSAGQGGVCAFRLSCAIAFGPAKVGNVGTAQLRRFSVITPLIPWLMTMEAYAKTCNVPRVTDDATVRHLERSIICRVFDAVVRERQNKVVPLLEVLHGEEATPQEWMYELMEMDAKGGDSQSVNSIARSIFKGDWDAAEKHRLVMAEGNTLASVWTEALERRKFHPLQRTISRSSETVQLNTTEDTAQSHASTEATESKTTEALSVSPALDNVC